MTKEILKPALKNIQNKPKKKLSSLAMLCALFFFLFIGSPIFSQNIPDTGNSTQICGDCNPVDWQEADGSQDGTPDISDANSAGGGTTAGAGASWTFNQVSSVTLPTPPTNHVRWITLRDVGSSNNTEENVATNITGLIPGVVYKLVIFTMTTRTLADGGAGNDTHYAGSYLDETLGVNNEVFAVEVSSAGIGNGERYSIPSITRDTWGQNTIIFIADAATMTFAVFPGANSAYDGSNSIENVEALHLSVGGAVNPLQVLDTDGDGIGDGVDIDDDNDGILDTTESGGFNPTGDDDFDGIPNYVDFDNNGSGGNLGDANGDGIQDFYDFDGDGVPNHLDLDSDGDGILDTVESQGTTLITPSGTYGANGLDNAYESGTEGGAYLISPVNTDSNGNPDYLDIDADNDGIPDNIEAQTTAGYIAPTGNVGDNGLDSAYENNDTYNPSVNNPVNTDSGLANADTIPDYRDSDSDGDGTDDIAENNRTTDGVNEDNVQPDVLSGTDSDGDGLDDNFDNVVNTPSNWDVNDEINSPTGNLYNSDPLSDSEVDYRDDVTGEDTDGDGIPDSVDIDDDNDGILDTEECPDFGVLIPIGNAAGVADSFSASNPSRAIGSNNSRSNLNSVNDYLIMDLGYIIPSGRDITIESRVSNNLGHQMSVEQSLDGVNFTNLVSGYTYASVGVDENKIYTLSGSARFIRIKLSVDGGAGALQIDNVSYESFVLADCRDTDSDGIPDYLDIDSDNDGIIDNVEAQPTTGYIPPSGSVGANGLYDIYEDNDTAGATVTAFTIQNTDGALGNSDTIPDYLDVDSDNDGIPDNVEAQTTSGYVAPTGNVGVNGLDSAYDFIDGYSDPGLSPVNTDDTLMNNADAILDYRDTDSDGDGTDDVDEKGGSAIFSGNDLNNNGLDDNFDAEGNLPYDANDAYDNPSTDLQDGDLDANSGGDVDYRDIIDGLDTDGDGIADVDDIDDDNDGIPDTEECGPVSVPGATAASVKAENSLGGGGGAASIDGDNAIRANMNNTNDFLILDLGLNVVPTTAITINAQTDDLGNVLVVEQSINNITFTNTQSITWTTGIDVDANYTYTITTDNARYIRLRLTTRISGSTKIDNVSYAGFTNPCGLDTDGDGIPNAYDLDSDNDGILDNIEAQTTAGYAAPTGQDSDNDGLDDAYDADCANPGDCTNDVIGAPITPVNTDASASDTIPDYLDIDSDNDGIPDNIEAQTTQGYVAPTGNVGANGIDSSYKSNDTFTATGLTPNDFSNTIPNIPDYRDTDSDNDGIPDIQENGMVNALAGTDADGDGLDDAFEGADDTAGEAWDVNDDINNPLTDVLPDADGDANAAGDLDYRDGTNIPDSDGDSIIDSIDIDDDNDGILDTVESGGNDPDGDEDNDGTLNYLDTSDDGDGGPGGTTNYTDTNGPNGVPDGIPDVYDSDNDGVPNHLDIDSDNDGIPDNIEAQPTTGYIAPSGSVGANGLYDIYEDNDTAGASVTAFTIQNTDSADNPDYLDDDSDGDGTPDIEENGMVDTFGTFDDADGDGLEDAFEGADATAGEAWDPNDDINNPLVDLPDDDGDSGSGGDMDYRDTTDDSVPVVTTGNTLWLRADKDVTGGGTVTLWEDQITSLDFVNGSGSPSATTNTLNFNPVITFDGSNDVLLAGSQNLNPASVYVVYNHTSAANVSTPFTNTSDMGVGDTDGTIYGSVPAAVSGATDYNVGLATDFETRPRPGTSYELHTSIFNTTGAFNSGLDYFVGANRNNSSTTINGNIAEIMVFDTQHSDTKRQQVESYLAIKYGFTLDGTAIPGGIIEGNYVTADGTLIWDNEVVKTYHNDVAGIGRDDAMVLLQKQSKSINSDAIITIGVGSIATTNLTNSGSITGNKSFLVWGNNNANLTNTNTTPILCSEKIQLQRIWKVVETGSIGSVEVAVTRATVNGFAIDTALDIAGITSETIVIIVADDSNFTTNVRHIPVTNRNIDGQDHWVADIDFSGTQYFTYATINGIFWNGDTSSWIGGSNGTIAGAPAIDAVNSAEDGNKVLIVDAESSGTNATLPDSANVECVWIKEDSKLMVTNNNFLEFNGEFQLDGEVRLLGNAQLVQSHTGFSNVTGNGKIFIDQKATVPNVYRYHYWSSPVVAALGNTTYTVADVMKDGTTPTSENSSIKDITFKSRVSGDVSTLNGETTDPITIANHWIYTYSGGNGNNRNNWVQQKENGAINIGDGFIMKSTGRTPQNFTFVGTPIDGTINKSISASDVYLVGNPYPSVLNAFQFINDNLSALDGTLYFWEHNGEETTSGVVEGHGEFGYIGGYAIRNLAQGVSAQVPIAGTAGLGNGLYNEPTNFVAVGQSFFVQADSNGGNFSFENSHRDFSAASIFFKGGKKNRNIADIKNFKLGFDYTNESNSEIHRQLGANFKSGNSFNYDNGYDSAMFDQQATDVYWKFQEIAQPLVIAGLGEFDIDMQIPLAINIDTDKPVYVMIDETTDMPNVDFFLIDVVNGTTYSLAQPVQLNLARGVYTDRFVIAFKDATLSTDDIEVSNNLSVFADNNTKEIVINNNNNLIIKDVELFNILGQKVQNWKNLIGTQNRLKTSSISSSVYIINITTDKGKMSKKVIFHK